MRRPRPLSALSLIAQALRDHGPAEVECIVDLLPPCAEINAHRVSALLAHARKQGHVRCDRGVYSLTELGRQQIDIVLRSRALFAEREHSRARLRAELLEAGVSC